jgi:HD-GYP domain-containing protein (c-di-GMP phosphodiesterase class II)
MLKRVAAIIDLCTPPTGYCARYGGDEFTLILPRMDVKKAKKVAERIRKTVEETDFAEMEVLPQGKLTVSIGIAEYPLMGTNKEKLIQKADEALYRAKFISKNKVETYYSVFDELSLTLVDKEKDIFNSIRTLTMVINAKDKYTYGHSERTMQLAARFAEKVMMSAESTTELIYSSLLHDIGKIEIARDIHNKPAKLNSSEWEILKSHPRWGADIIRPLKSFQGIVEIVLYHHENYDGSGYPKGIQGLEIPYGARVLRIIDSFDAITTNRPYKPGMNKEQAIEELGKFSGIHYDSAIFQQFAEMVLNESYKLDYSHSD